MHSGAHLSVAEMCGGIQITPATTYQPILDLLFLFVNWHMDGISVGINNALVEHLKIQRSLVFTDYNNVVIIPAGATNIDVRQHSYRHLQDDENYLGEKQ